MDLLEKVRNCNNDELEGIIRDAINDKNENSNKIEKLGFLNNKTNYKFFGFIPLDTRIKYSSMGVEDYSMKTTDFLYEFGDFIRKYDVSNKAMLIHSLETFINKYFGIYPFHTSYRNNKTSSSDFCFLLWIYGISK